MDLDKFIKDFFVAYFAEYNATIEQIESYNIEGTTLTIKHLGKYGKQFVTEFSVWEVMAFVYERKQNETI